MGASISFNHTKDFITLRVHFMSAEHKLELVTNEGVSDLYDGFQKSLPKLKFEYKIRSKTQTNCQLPYDKIDLKTCNEKEEVENNAAGIKLKSRFYLLISLLACLILL